MAFEKYYYPALDLLKAKNNSSKINQLHLTGLNSSYVNSIYIEMIDSGFCELNNDIISMTEKGNNYLIENNQNPENKELHIRILEYIRVNNKYGNCIDIVIPFLHEVANHEQRLELLQTIRQLKNDGYINLKGRENVLVDKLGGTYTSIYSTGISASLTEKGEAKISPANSIEEKPTNVTNYYFHNSIGTNIGENNQSSIIVYVFK